MRNIIVSEWVTLDGVFDAEPQYFGVQRILGRPSIESADALLLGATTYKMLAPYWSAQENDDNGPARKLNSMKKYVVSSTLKE